SSWTVEISSPPGPDSSSQPAAKIKNENKPRSPLSFVVLSRGEAAEYTHETVLLLVYGLSIRTPHAHRSTRGFQVATRENRAKSGKCQISEVEIPYLTFQDVRHSGNIFHSQASQLYRWLLI
ncbi:hypothetical protein T310_8896, partial [Rasamsonia emersonii CBS 393.64]